MLPDNTLAAALTGHCTLLQKAHKVETAHTNRIDVIFSTTSTASELGNTRYLLSRKQYKVHKTSNYEKWMSVPLIKD